MTTGILVVDDRSSAEAIALRESTNLVPGVSTSLADASFVAAGPRRVAAPKRRRRKGESSQTISLRGPFPGDFFKERIDPTTEYSANGSFDRPTHRCTQCFFSCIEKNIYGQASRLISIGKLNASPRLHTRPITWSSSRSL